jgi:hypothetical protein
MSLNTLLFAGLLLTSLISCRRNAQEEMQHRMVEARLAAMDPRNLYAPEAKLIFIDSVINAQTNENEKVRSMYSKASILLELGREEEAVVILEEITKKHPYLFKAAWRDLGIAYLRLGERTNCISNHAAESCILPIKGVGVHRDSTGSLKAIEVFKFILSQNSNDLESKWLLNLAYMTLGQYPKKVPPVFLIPGMEGDTTNKIMPFIDVAGDLEVDVINQAGGSITDDFDNDGYLDIVTSSWSLNEPMHYFRNNGNGTFSDRSIESGLSKVMGGLNITQADYNNDGFLDILVLRGAWKVHFGNEPNSLLRNNGDGTFTDVTLEAGMFSKHPTQTATWNDFNNDGWLDVFIGNEASSNLYHPCEFYINNGDGTFSEVAEASNCKIVKYVKGVTSGDYDHDGWKDLFLSTMSGQRILLKNKGIGENGVSFEDVSEKAGISKAMGNTFPTWFFDYDNDGWLDIFVCDYTFKTTLAYYTAAEKLGIAAGSAEKMLLYHNNHDGTFTNVAEQAGLNKVAFAMGSNFGDIDNDGLLDIYLGTGNPHFQSLVPNKLFKNLGDGKFADVTRSARVGHLQKGHGVSFADLDNDGDQDIHADMGGAYTGDSYQNSLFLNPGQGGNNWINILLEGTTSNRSAIGTLVKITCTENGTQRTIYRDVNSGGSFGSSPLRREIGLGSATKIDQLEITWHGSGKVQVFENIAANQFIKITEGNEAIEKRDLKQIIWTLPDRLCLPGEVPTSIAGMTKK